MKKVYIDTVNSQIVLGNTSQTVHYKISNQDGSTFVSRKTDKLTLVVSLGSPDKVITIESSQNYLGNIKFVFSEQELSLLTRGTYLAEVILTDDLGEQQIIPHMSYLELQVS